MSFLYPINPVVGQDYIINDKSLRYNGVGFIPSPQTSVQAPDVLTKILPTDYICGRRSVTGAEWTFETLRNNIIASGGASDDIRLDGSNVVDLNPAVLPGDKMLIKKGNYNFELVDVASFARNLSGTAGTWEFSYDNGDVLVFGDASKSGRFGIKVAFKFKARATAYECKLFPNKNIGTWVRFEHADWCINADNTGRLANLNQSLTVKGFYDSVTNFTRSGNYSHIAGAGAVQENQQDDFERYLNETQRIRRNDCTFTIGTNTTESTAEVWLLIHLSGTIL